MSNKLAIAIAIAKFPAEMQNEVKSVLQMQKDECFEQDYITIAAAIHELYAIEPNNNGVYATKEYIAIAPYVDLIVDEVDRRRYRPVKIKMKDVNKYIHKKLKRDFKKIPDLHRKYDQNLYKREHLYAELRSLVKRQCLVDMGFDI